MLRHRRRTPGALLRAVYRCIDAGWDSRECRGGKHVAVSMESLAVSQKQEMMSVRKSSRPKTLQACH